MAVTQNADRYEGGPGRLFVTYAKYYSFGNRDTGKKLDSSQIKSNLCLQGLKIKQPEPLFCKLTSWVFTEM